MPDDIVMNGVSSKIFNKTSPPPLQRRGATLWYFEITFYNQILKIPPPEELGRLFSTPPKNRNNSSKEEEPHFNTLKYL